MTVYEKLLKVQTELKAPKSQYNSFGKYHYRSAEDILEAVKPICAQFDCVIYLSDDVVFLEGRHYIRSTATFVECQNGEKISVSAQAREDESKKGMDGAQLSGATSSYARKYALNGLLDVDDCKDSDETEGLEAKNADLKHVSALCEDCGKEIVDSVAKNGSVWSADDICKYSNMKFGRSLCPDCIKKAGKAT